MDGGRKTEPTQSCLPNPDKAVSCPEYGFDIGNPYKGPAETDSNLWIGYGRKRADRVDWRTSSTCAAWARATI
ncbi:MAG: hypothetical protein ACOZE5_00265 [Verrucomicrobiota bacterium]